MISISFYIVTSSSGPDGWFHLLSAWCILAYWQTKGALRVFVVVANFMSILQLAISSILSLSSHARAAVICQTAANLRILFSENTASYGILRPNWIKWAGISEKIFSLLLHEQGEERKGLLTKHSDYCWNIGPQYLTLISIQIYH